MQNNVDLTTREDDLKIKYGMIDFGVEREMARTSAKYILTDVNDIRRTYIRLGFHLAEFERCEYYKDFGYTSLAEFCDVNIGMDKSAVSRCIAVFKEFAYRNNNGTRNMSIDDRYSEYSYSQLCEMVSMDDDTRRSVKPSMTIKQIRELKKELKTGKKESYESVATSQQDRFCINNFCNYKGAVLQNWIKNLPCDDVKFLSLFDENGKEIHKYLTCDVLCIDSNKIVLRVSKELTEEDFV